MYTIFDLFLFTLSAVIIAVNIIGISLSGRQWNPRQGLVSGWVAAPAVDVQSDSGSAGSVAAVTDEIHAWLCGNWHCPQTPALSPLSFPQTPECCNSKPLVALVCSCNFPICRVDIACLEILFTNIYEAKIRPSCRSSSSGKLAIEYVSRNSFVIHAAYMAKPAQPTLTEQGEHARYFRLR